MNLDSLASKVLVFGVPAALGMCAWGLLEIIDNGKQLERVLTSVEAMQREINSQDGRLNRLEDRYFNK